MWTELVPMSMAASRMGSDARGITSQGYNRKLILTWSIRPSPSRCFANDSSRCCRPCRRRRRATKPPCTRRVSRRGGCAKRCRCWARAPTSDTLDRAQTRGCAASRAPSVRSASWTLHCCYLPSSKAKARAPVRAIERVRKAVIDERQKRRREMLDEITPSRLDKLAQAAGRASPRPSRERTCRATRWPKRPQQVGAARPQPARPPSSAPAASISPIACIASASTPRSCATRSRFSAS